MTDILLAIISVLFAFIAILISTVFVDVLRAGPGRIGQLRREHERLICKGDRAAARLQRRVDAALR